MSSLSRSGVAMHLYLLPLDCSGLTVHVTSYLWKSDDFLDNPSQISVKVCAEFRGSSVASSRNHLLGVLRIVFWAPTDLSYGSPPNDLWETEGYWTCEIVLGVLKLLWNLLWMFRGNPSAEHSAGRYRGSVDPSNVSADTHQCFGVWWFHWWFMEVCRLPRGNSQKTYTANSLNFVTNLWHVPYPMQLDTCSPYATHNQDLGIHFLLGHTWRWPRPQRSPPPGDKI